MKIIITGITSLIGRHLANTLSVEYEVIGLSRNPEKAKSFLPANVKTIYWDGKTLQGLEKILTGEYSIINLAGEPISGKRWTDSQKQKIINSRINASQAIKNSIEKAEKYPHAIVQASATGIYGQDPDKSFTEKDPAGKGFLAETSRQWELTVNEIKNHDIRIPILRTGVVLSMEGGALPRLLMPFKYYLGGYPSSGRQWVSWIHINDEVKAIRYLLESPHTSGPYNLTAPGPVQMKELAKTAGKILGKPSRTKAPAFIIETIYRRNG